MIKTLCKTCGTRHWPRERCPALPSFPTGTATKTIPDQVKRQDRIVEVAREAETIMSVAVPLTGAQRAASYRERHPDEVKQRDRERKAAKKPGRER